MTFDYSLPSVNPAVLVFTECVFPDQPKAPSEVKNTVTLTGTQTGVSSSLAGTSDGKE